ncbi:hypothetical protein [Arsenicicoccus dermatophilus]|uniref:hypothetical protein n=1 Tax=Arsenicicoccus dermatophilus TaxID=1076331 RepID=UPI001F4CC974|nr:hypothetical protein [Arsenicicoccus dermatophilus]MCH8613431.1 hypothetical protein [Arsenicicoccus dermatophilus]
MWDYDTTPAPAWATATLDTHGEHDDLDLFDDYDRAADHAYPSEITQGATA